MTAVEATGPAFDRSSLVPGSVLFLPASFEASIDRSSPLAGRKHVDVRD